MNATERLTEPEKKIVEAYEALFNAILGPLDFINAQGSAHGIFQVAQEFSGRVAGVLAKLDPTFEKQMFGKSAQEQGYEDIAAQVLSNMMQVATDMVGKQREKYEDAHRTGDRSREAGK